MNRFCGENGDYAVAKRFTETEKWKDRWFMELRPVLKLAWLYVVDQCDSAGVWEVNLPLLGFSIGEDITREELQTGLGDRVCWLSNDRAWIPKFIPFQYKTLKPTTKAHRGIFLKVLAATRGLPLAGPALETIEELKTLFQVPADPQLTPDRPLIDSRVGVDRPSTEGRSTPQVKVKEEEEEEGGTGGDFLAEVCPQGVTECVEIWAGTLARHQVDKDPRFDELAIARLVLRNGIERTKLALLGAGHEAKGEGYNPSEHIGVYRLEDPKAFDKFVNLGAQQKAKQARAAEAEAARQARVAASALESREDDDWDAPNPERVRATLAAAGFGKAMP